MTPIYHITHLNNLRGIIDRGHLCCDSRAAAAKINCVSIAHQHIKDRRARKRVTVAPGGFVAHYVPFYFAPRSPMLYAINQGNVAGYEGGQTKVLHLVSSVERVLSEGYSYCFTDGHAEMGPTLFFNNWRDEKEKVPWAAMRLRYWNDTPANPIASVNDRRNFSFAMSFHGVRLKPSGCMMKMRGKKCCGSLRRLPLCE